jgi:ammonia channel protein AmtB
MIIAPIMTIGYGLCSSIIVYGLDVYDGGGGLTVFLYSGMCSVMIWLISIRGKISITKFKKSESYINYTFAFIGVMIALISWPQFNMAGATLSFLNTNLSSSSSLQNSAFVNTLLALSVALLCSFMLASKDSK